MAERFNVECEWGTVGGTHSDGLHLVVHPNDDACGWTRLLLDLAEGVCVRIYTRDVVPQRLLLSVQCVCEDQHDRIAEARDAFQALAPVIASGDYEIYVSRS